MSRLAVPVYGGNAEESELPALVVGLPRSERRRFLREEIKARKRTLQRPLTAADIPAGSLISESTLADIEAGLYALRLNPAAPTPPSTKASVRRRRRLAAERTHREPPA